VGNRNSLSEQFFVRETETVGMSSFFSAGNRNSRSEQFFFVRNRNSGSEQVFYCEKQKQWE